MNTDADVDVDFRTCTLREWGHGVDALLFERGIVATRTFAGGDVWVEGASAPAVLRMLEGNSLLRARGFRVRVHEDTMVLRVGILPGQEQVAGVDDSSGHPVEGALGARLVAEVACLRAEVARQAADLDDLQERLGE